MKSAFGTWWMLIHSHSKKEDLDISCSSSSCANSQSSLQSSSLSAFPCKCSSTTTNQKTLLSCKHRTWDGWTNWHSQPSIKLWVRRLRLPMWYNSPSWVMQLMKSCSQCSWSATSVPSSSWLLPPSTGRAKLTRSITSSKKTLISLLTRLSNSTMSLPIFLMKNCCSSSMKNLTIG